MRTSTFVWIPLLALAVSLGSGCKQEEPPAPQPEPQVAEAFDLKNTGLVNYAEWSATGKAVADAREYLKANPKAADGEAVAEMAAKVTLDAAVAAVLSGKEDALDALGLEASDTGKVAAAGASVAVLMTDRLAIANRDNLLRLSKALTAEGKERMEALLALSKDSGGLEGRATALLMQDLMPTLKRYQETPVVELDPMVVEEIVKQALDLSLKDGGAEDPLQSTLEAAEKAFQSARDVNVSFALGGSGESPDTGKPAATPAGPAWTTAPLTVIALNESGVRVAHRPTLRVKDGKKEDNTDRALAGPAQFKLEEVLAPGKEASETEAAVPSGQQRLADEIAAVAKAAREGSGGMSGVVPGAEDKGQQVFVQAQGFDCGSSGLDYQSFRRCRG